MSAASPSLLQEVEASDVESDTGSDIDVIDEKRSRSSDGRGSDGDGYSTNIDSSSGNGSSSNSKTLSFSTQRRLRSFTTTTCTTCSICIEEFENGEKNRLLLLCGHSFHTDCILPWLERQGCCPLWVAAMLNADNSIPTVDSNSSIRTDDDNANNVSGDNNMEQ